MDALGASGLDIEFLSARPVGMLAVHRSRVAEMPDANLRQALQAAAPDLDATSGSTGLFFIGGHAGCAAEVRCGATAIRRRPKARWRRSPPAP